MCALQQTFEPVPTRLSCGHKHPLRHAGRVARCGGEALLMDRSLHVETPESMAFSYDLAGLGTRFLAVSIDAAIQIAILTGIFIGLALIASHMPGKRVPLNGTDASTDLSVGIAVLTVVVFLVWFGYFVIFESLWQGQTPGKRGLRIRAIRDGGYPLDFGSAAIRNLVRIGEIALGYYALSAVATLLSSENKRFGDMAAGTIVVREHSIRAIGAAPASAPLRSAISLSREECDLIEAFVARQETLPLGLRLDLATQLAERFRARVPHDWQRLHPEDILRRLHDGAT